MTNPFNPMINSEALQPFMQPYIRLTQRNMQLFTSFSVSPEMVTLWLQNAQKMVTHAAKSTASGKTADEPQKMVEQVQSNLSDVGQSRAFAGLLQGVMQSHMQFMMDLAQTGVAAVNQAPAKMLESMQHTATSALSETALLEEQPRRSRRKAH
jgi:hypothetical protein